MNRNRVQWALEQFYHAEITHYHGFDDDEGTATAKEKLTLVAQFGLETYARSVYVYVREDGVRAYFDAMPVSERWPEWARWMERVIMAVDVLRQEVFGQLPHYHLAQELD